MDIKELMKELMMNTVGASCAMTATQLGSFPLARLMNQKFVKPSKPYYEILKDFFVYERKKKSIYKCPELVSGYVSSSNIVQTYTQTTRKNYESSKINLLAKDGARSYQYKVFRYAARQDFKFIDTLAVLYKGILKNTFRRMVLMCCPMSLIKTLEKEYKLSPVQIMMLSTITSSCLTLICGEVREKNRLSCGVSKIGVGNYIYASKFIFARELLFANVAFNVRPVIHNYFEKHGKELSKTTGVNEVYMRSTASICAVLLLSFLTTPFDRCATLFAHGGKKMHQLAGDLFNDPKTIFAGGAARCAFITSAACFIPWGMEHSKKVFGMVI